MRIQGGLRPDDWRRWGQFTTAKSNAAALLGRELRGNEAIYCSPLVDPYQPAEARMQLMPGILDALLVCPPRVFVLQTRGPLIVRDIDRIARVAARTAVRVSFSLTTDREDVRRLFEPYCEPLGARLDAIARLRAAGLRVFATLAPILPCDPARLIHIALDATAEDIIVDPLHVRETKPRGATTRDAAIRICRRHGFERWLDPAFQSEVLQRMTAHVQQTGRRVAAGTEGFSWLAQ